VSGIGHRTLVCSLTEISMEEAVCRLENGRHIQASADNCTDCVNTQSHALLGRLCNRFLLRLIMADDSALASQPSMVSIDEITALAALLAISDDPFSTFNGGLSALEAATDAALTSPTPLAECASAKQERGDRLRKFLEESIGVEDAAPIPLLPEAEYTRGLPEEVRKKAGDSHDVDAVLRQLDADRKGETEKAKARRSDSSPLPAASAAASSMDDGAADAGEGDNSPAAPDGDDAAAVAAFERYLKRLPADVRGAARGLQELGLINADGSGGSEVESEYYRAYLQLLAGTTNAGDASPEARAAAAEAAAAISGVKRKRTPGAPASTAAGVGAASATGPARTSSAGAPAMGSSAESAMDARTSVLGAAGTPETTGLLRPATDSEILDSLS